MERASATKSDFIVCGTKRPTLMSAEQPALAPITPTTKATIWEKGISSTLPPRGTRIIFAVDENELRKQRPKTQGRKTRGN